MTYEQRDNTGSLFVNDRKESENHPDRQGSIMVDGREYWLSGWVKKSKDGKPWLSLAIKPKDQKQPARKGGGARREEDDPIPF